MIETFNKLRNEFTKKHNSLTFNPAELDKLNYEERKAIEDKLLRLCKSGSIDCFKYIPYMKYALPEKEIDFNLIESFPIFHQATISYALFQRTKSMTYYEKLVKCANLDIKSFGLLINMYAEAEDNNLKSSIRSSLENITLAATGRFKTQCEALINRNMNGDGTITMKPDQNEKDEIQSTRFESEGIKAYTKEEYLAKLAAEKAQPNKKLDDMLEAIKAYEDNGESKQNFKK